MEHIFSKVTLHAVQQRLSSLADTAAQHHILRVYHITDVSQKFTHICIDLLQNLQRKGITLRPGIEHVLTCKVFLGAQCAGSIGLFQKLLCDAHDAGGRAILLHAAFLPQPQLSVSLRFKTM